MSAENVPSRCKQFAAWTCLVAALASGGLITGCSAPGSTVAAPSPFPTLLAATPTPRQSGEPAECFDDPYGCAVIPPGDTIKIGMAGPMSGPYAQFGLDIADAGRLAVEDFGTYLGWLFELETVDTRADPVIAELVASQWAGDPTVVGVAGHIFSGETRAAIPIYEDHGIPMLSPSATNPDLVRLGSSVFNRVAFTDVVQARYAADYLFGQLRVSTLAVVDDGEEYGSALALMVADSFERLGGQIVARATLASGAPDMAAQLKAILSTNPQAIYYGGYDDVAIQIVNGIASLQQEAAATQAATSQATPTPAPAVIFFGCDGTFGQNFLDSTGANGEGAYATSLIPPDSEAKSRFDAHYLERYGVEAGTRSPYTWHGYDAVSALIYAAKRVAIVGRDGNLYVPRGALVHEVRNLRDYPGLSGIMTCDEVGECSTTGPSFYVIRQGQWVPAP